jgi:hypothetical protein
VTLPDDTPQELVDIIWPCFEVEAENRPAFADIVAKLDRLRD